MAAVLWMVTPLLSPGGKAKVRILVNDQSYGEYSLGEAQEISIGAGNTCEIKDGKVQMIWADCPDQLCVHQKALDDKGQGAIICLPNKVVIEVAGAGGRISDDEPDAVAG